MSEQREYIAQKLNLSFQDEQRNKTIYIRRETALQNRCVSVQIANCEILLFIVR